MRTVRTYTSVAHRPLMIAAWRTIGSPASIAHTLRDLSSAPAKAVRSADSSVEPRQGNAVRSLAEERAAELAARTLALPDAQSVEDLTALLTSAEKR